MFRSRSSSVQRQGDTVDHDGLPSSPTWCVDDVTDTSGVTTVRGWYVGPAAAKIVIAVNGRRIVPVEVARPDLDEMVIAGAGNVVSGFACTVRRPLSTGLELTPIVDDQRLDSLTAWYPPARAIGAVPESMSRTRVHGGDSLSSFLLEGYTSYRRLSDLLAERIPRRRRTRIRLLDWGCGCGRVTRYFIEDQRFQVVGVDIDRDNVGWCRDNLTGQFETISPLPPIELDDGSFDAVIGVSVMTHLNLEMQQTWAKDIVRLLAPNGVAALTTHGWSTVRRSGLPVEMVASFAAAEFIDGGVNPDIPASVVETGYYRNVFNTPQQIRRDWSAIATVEDVIPALVGQHQDVVVLRKHSVAK